jgi:hypothetical protein
VDASGAAICVLLQPIYTKAIIKKMSAVEELLAQYRQKAQISKSRKRPRETITADLVAERTTKNKTENTSENKFEKQPSELTPLG